MLYIIPTIDVEGMHGTNPFDQFILGDVGSGENWGIYRLANTFSRYGVSATFFVDCYEYTFWGEGRLEEVCQRLLEYGQDVQLHTHPAWRDDPCDFPWLRQLKREKSYLSQSLDFMTKLSFDQQVETLLHGADLIEKWTGSRPIAHRSGGYSCNEDTIRALSKAHIPVDSSMNAAHPNSQITWSKNQIVERDGIIELPVTVMEYSYNIPVLGKLYSKLMKTDIDSATTAELESYVNQASVLGLKTMNLFMHSYSLLAFDLFYRSIRPAPTQLTKLEELLEAMSNRPDVEFMSCRSFLNAYRAMPDLFVGPDAIPTIQARSKITALAMRKGINKLRETVAR